MADAEQEYNELIVTGDGSTSRSLQTLRDIISVKKWEINQAHGAELPAQSPVKKSP
ncbi:phage polarity suppression protein [Hafnia alvei]|uniref:phage polarity suppression protein n=1 Tax=Hafnia alvei TaxID=569 RepID=UPI00398B7664